MAKGAIAHHFAPHLLSRAQQRYASPLFAA